MIEIHSVRMTLGRLLNIWKPEIGMGASVEKNKLVFDESECIEM